MIKKKKKSNFFAWLYSSYKKQIHGVWGGGFAENYRVKLTGFCMNKGSPEVILGINAISIKIEREVYWGIDYARLRSKILNFQNYSCFKRKIC